MQTRLERKGDRNSKMTIMFFLAGSILLLGIFIYFGVPALFGLANTISGMGKETETVEGPEEVVLNSPTLNRDFEATKSAEIKVTGIADPNSKVELERNTVSVGLATADKSGKFTFDDVTLVKGKNDLVARTITNSGKKSEPSDSYIVFFSTSGPKLETTNKDGDTVRDNPYTFTGKVDPITATVTVNGNMAIVDSQGNFSYYMNLNSGDNKITIIGSDEAGNETKQEMNLKYEH